MQAFPPLEQKSLFLASPSDVAHLRRMAQTVFKEMVSHGPRKLDCHIFAWESAELEENDAIPIQEQISRPDDPKSLGLAAFFGEKIGQPLASDFPKDMLDCLPALYEGGLHEGRRYRLVHPWILGEEERGGFPLTGSTFELLCALAGEREMRQIGSDQGLPTFICFSSPSDVMDQQDTALANWGMNVWLDRIDTIYRHDRRERNRQTDLALIQRDQLRNLACYLKTLGVEIRFIPDDTEILNAYRKFLNKNFITATDPTAINPFMGLKSYDVRHTQAYFGRQEEIDTAVRSTEEAFADPEAPNFFWVKGSSGVGKSSFLRAGLIGTLVSSHLKVANYAHHVFRPNQLLSKAAAADADHDDPLLVLFEAALKSLQHKFVESAPKENHIAELCATFLDLEPTKRPSWVIKTLDQRTAETEREGNSLPSRLVIGIDQFEEIVDMLHDKEYCNSWVNFVEFISEVHQADRLFVVATLREKRLEKMRAHETLGKFWDATSKYVLDLELPSPTALDRIIRRPFDNIGHAKLSEELVTAIKKEIRDLRSGYEGRTAGSIMPLVSLALERLNVEVAEPKWRQKFKHREDTGDSSDPSDALNTAATQDFDAGPVDINLNEAKEYIKLDDVISELARRAMDEAHQKNAFKAGESTLEDLLRILVRWTGSDDEDETQLYLPTISMPEDHDQATLARALLNHRILMNEGDGKIRLVHETVLRNWPQAAAFRERERPLYKKELVLHAFAEDWSASEDKSINAYQLGTYGEAACDMLGLWTARFHNFFTKELAPRDIQLRDYCLAILREINDPCRLIERTPKRSHHLYIAAMYGRTDIVEAMLQKDKSAARFTRDDGRNAIFPVCFTGGLEILNLLIQYGADVNAEEKDEGWQPIHFASYTGNIAFVQRLLDKGAKLDTGRCYPIHYAAYRNHAELVTYFLDKHNIDPDIRDDNGWTAAAFAAAGNACDVLPLLAKRTDLTLAIELPDQKSVQLSAIHIAAANGHLEAIQTLVDLGVPVDLPDRAGGTALHYAANEGFHASVALLARMMHENGGVGANPKMIHAWSIDKIENAEKELASDNPGNKALKLADWTPLHIAAAKGDVKVTKSLVEGGADPDIPNRAGLSPLHTAIAEDQVDVALWLAASGANLECRDKTGDTPLQAAIKREDMSLAVELSAKEPGRKFDYLHEDQMDDRYRATLFHKAAMGNNEKLTSFLLNATLAEDGLPDAFGRTPLHIAALHGQSGQVKIFLDSGLPGLFIKDRNGATPLDLAASAGRYRAAACLIKAAAGQNLQEKAPEALHHAARGGSHRIVQALVEVAYSINCLDSHGRTPLMVAVLHNNSEVVSWLLAQEPLNTFHSLRDRLETTAYLLAVESGSENCLQILIANMSKDELPINQLAWSAVDCMQFDCAALILETFDQYDLLNDETGELLSEFYAKKCKQYTLQFPRAITGSKRLEDIFNSGRGTTGQIAREPEDEFAFFEQQKLRSTVYCSKVEVSTQSREHGYASDIYPMFDRKKALWQPLTGQALTDLIKQISPVGDKHIIHAESVRCYQRKLPWYKDVRLIQMMDPDNFERSNLAICFLEDSGNLFWLNGTSPPIHEVNAKAPIELSIENVADYLRFFFFFVRGDDGPFYIMEHADDPLIPSGDLGLSSIVTGTARPINYNGCNEEGHYLFDAVLYYANAIFRANIAVQPSGMIEMIDDKPLAGDLSMKIDCPLS